MDMDNELLAFLKKVSDLLPALQELVDEHQQRKEQKSSSVEMIEQWGKERIKREQSERAAAELLSQKIYK